MASSCVSEFVWAGVGVLGPDPGEPVGWVEVVRERCRSLGFSGRLALVDAHGAALWFQDWCDGEERDNYLSGTLIAGHMWNGSGEDASACAGFRVVQRMPDFDGDWTERTSLHGDLERGTIQRIVALCTRYRLSADLVLRRATSGPERPHARVCFSRGIVDAVTIVAPERTGSRPEVALAFLADTWRSGDFALHNRPQFTTAFR